MKKTLFDSWVQLGLLVVSGLTMLGSFALFVDGRYARADSVKELKGEIDALYLKLIPDQERAPLQHHEVIHQ